MDKARTDKGHVARPAERSRQDKDARAVERDRRGAPGRGWQLFVVLAPWGGLLIALVNAVGFLLIWRDADVAVVLGVVGLGYPLSGLVLLLVALAHRRRLRADGRL